MWSELNDKNENHDALVSTFFLLKQDNLMVILGGLKQDPLESNMPGEGGGGAGNGR